MKKSLFALAFAVSALAPLGTSSLASAATTTTTNAANCTISVVGSTNGVGQATSRFVVNADGTVSTTVVVKGTDCTKTVSLASWRAPYGVKGFQPLTGQTLLTSKTYALGEGTHKLTIDKADCMYQIDLVNGSEATVKGTPVYTSGMLLGFVQAGNKVCEKPVVTPTPTPAPTPTPSTPATTTPTDTPTPPASVEAPAVLVNTGAGDTIALFGFTVVAAALLHRVVTRRRLAA